MEMCARTMKDQLIFSLMFLILEIMKPPLPFTLTLDHLIFPYILARKKVARHVNCLTNNQYFTLCFVINSYYLLFQILKTMSGKRKTKPRVASSKLCGADQVVGAAADLPIADLPLVRDVLAKAKHIKDSLTKVGSGKDVSKKKNN